MAEFGQGSGVPTQIQETPSWISHQYGYGEHGDLARKIGTGKELLSPASARRVYAEPVPKEEFEGEFPETAQFDGTDSDRTHVKDVGIIKAGYSKKDGEESKSAYLHGNDMLPEMPVAPITGRSSVNSMEHFDLHLDSGASRHMVSKPAFLSNRRDLPAGADKFRCADGVHLAVAGYGDIEKGNFKIPDVYWVQGLTLNLISVGQLASNHKVGSCFSGNACDLMLSDGRRIGGAIRRDDNQYILRFLMIE